MKPKTRIFVIAFTIGVFSLSWYFYNEEQKRIELVKLNAELAVKLNAELALIKRESNKTTEIEPSEFSSKCAGASDSCVGKFVVWEGSLLRNASSGSKELYLSAVNGRSTLTLMKSISQDMSAGTKVLFHARIQQLNAFGADKFSGGYVRSVIQTGEAVAQRQAEEKTAEATRRAAAAEEADVRGAGTMGVSLAQFREADSARIAAWIACQRSAKSQATYGGASANWTPDYSWRVSGRQIFITGRDVEMKNGFGASRNVSYDCTFDLDTKNAAITSIR